MFNELPEVKLEYFELADSLNLRPISNVDEASHPILCIAAYFGELRLIDNVLLP